MGLELDELPVLAPGFKAPLQPGQVVAVESKFVFPGLGAVWVENTWAVVAGAGEKLTVLADGGGAGVSRPDSAGASSRSRASAAHAVRHGPVP